MFNFKSLSHLKNEVNVYWQVRQGDTEPQGVILVAPSITPIAIINPSARLFYLNPDDFSLIEYEQYYFDLQEVIGKSALRVTGPTTNRNNDEEG